MLIPSLDLMGGKVVQLVGGRELEWSSADVMGWAEKLAVCGELAVVDLDAAMGKGDNDAIVRELCRRFDCRVGGGVRTEERARTLLKAGARRLMVGTAATPEFLQKLPSDVWIACLDHKKGIVVDRGWTNDTGERVEDRAKRLAPYVAGFLVTNVEVEGSMQGPHESVAVGVRKETGLPVTAAGGVRNTKDVIALHAAGLDAQVGMAIYTGVMNPAETFVSCVDFDRMETNGLAPTFVVDANGRALMVAWSSRESLLAALQERRGIYYSRSRNELWRKGDTSGHTQELIRAGVDCDADALVFVVEQTGPVCHTGAATCFGDRRFDLAAFESHVQSKMTGEGYTAKLASNTRLAKRKVAEEAYEVVDAVADGTRDELVGEAADLLYHTLALLGTKGVTVRDIEAELAGRRRP